MAACVTILLFASGCPKEAEPCDSNFDCNLNERCMDGQCVQTSDSGVGGGDAGADAGSPSVGVRCGASRPCPTGFVCEQGACDIDCAGESRCDGGCCSTGEVCYLGECTVPGAVCGVAGGGGASCVAAACSENEQCDPALGRCLPLPPAQTCTAEPGASFDPTLLWAWNGSSEYSSFRNVLSTPAVADINGDGASDVIVTALESIFGTPLSGAILCALSGAGDCEGGSQELWCTAPTGARVNEASHPAVADLDGDGELTIVMGAGLNGPLNNWLTYGLYGFRPNGERIRDFGTDSSGMPVLMFVGVGGPAIADLDGDGLAEVFVGFTVFDYQGHLLWQRPEGYGNVGFGPLNIAADLDGDGDLEIVGGNMAYHHDGSEAWAPGADARSLADGWPAVADLNNDGQPEVVVVSDGTVRVFDRFGNLFGQATGVVAGRGGPPTVADVDGDGRPEIAVAGQDSLTVFAVGDAPNHALTVHWQMTSRDFSSNYTGSSVFDFDGDGRTEVIYADECFARVYDGPGNGAGATTVRFEVPNTSCTGTEYPVVADVNGDGKAEFVVVSSGETGATSACRPFATACASIFPGYAITTGVRVYRDRNDNWVPTRAIWNQHSYHVTNVCDGTDSVCSSSENVAGRVPRREQKSWAFPSEAPLNRYRVNARLEDVFAASDLVVSELRADFTECPAALTLRASVTNLGAIGVPPGVPLTFRRTDTAPQENLGTVATRSVLLPGGSERLSLRIELPDSAQGVPIRVEAVIDMDENGDASARECREDNNVREIALTCTGLI